MATETPADISGAGVTAAELGQALGTDFLEIGAELGEAELEYLRKTRRFVRDEVLPNIDEYWQRAEFPFDLARRLGELGLLGAGIDGYGCPAMSFTSSGLITMELSRGDGSLGTFLGVQADLAMRSIAMYGSDEQKQRWLPQLAKAEAFGAFALTEPQHGSDSVALETRAVADGGDFVLDGRKRWIGNGTIADVVVVWARGEDGQVGGYLVEPKTMPGYRATVIEGKGSLRAVWQANIELAGVRVPASAKLPGANRFKDTGRVLAGTRNQCAFAALGHATAGYDAALTYAKKRYQFGRPLAGFQIVQHKLAGMLADVVGMQLYCLRVAQLADRGEMTDHVASLAKLNNGRKARQVLLEARDMLGGNGILLENHVMRHMADLEGIYTYEGTDTIQALLVGRHITGIAAFT
jgi:glutaryl-CoA dehydrogenase